MIFPAAVTARLPEMVEAPRSTAPLSLSVTSSPVVITTGPPNVLPASASVMSLALPAASVVVPVTARAPLCVIGSLEVTVRLPLIVEVAKVSTPVESASLSVTLRPLMT